MFTHLLTNEFEFLAPKLAIWSVDELILMRSSLIYDVSRAFVIPKLIINFTISITES